MTLTSLLQLKSLEAGGPGSGRHASLEDAAKHLVATMPKTGTWIKSNIPQTTGNKPDWTKGKTIIKDVKISDIKSTQPLLDPGSLKYNATHQMPYKKDNSHLPNVGVNEIGDKVVGDGNHRLALAKEMGDDTIRVRFNQPKGYSV